MESGLKWKETPNPSTDPAEPSLPVILAKAPVMRMRHLGWATPVKSPDDCSPRQHHVEQKSHPNEPSQLAGS